MGVSSFQGDLIKGFPCIISVTTMCLYVSIVQSPTQFLTQKRKFLNKFRCVCVCMGVCMCVCVCVCVVGVGGCGCRGVWAWVCARVCMSVCMCVCVLKMEMQLHSFGIIMVYFSPSQTDLDVSSERVAQYKGEPLRTGGGVVTVHTLTSATIR